MNTVVQNRKKLKKYVNSYGLWQKSNTSDADASNSVVIPPEVVKPVAKGVEVVRDIFNRKMVKREGLYSTVDLPKEAIPPVTIHELRSRRGQPVNMIQVNLTKALAQPVEISKGASMLQKMGWQGGALGKAGVGIVEPIAPDATYAATTKGLGHTYIRVKNTNPANKPKAKAKEYLKQGNKQVFKMNILKLIFDFVQDDNEIELVFEDTLMAKERLVIHSLVNSVINVDEKDISECWCNEMQMELVRSIQDRSCYVLGTKSHGEIPKRQLTIFKETPPNVYVVIPDDLSSDDVTASAANSEQQNMDVGNTETTPCGGGNVARNNEAELLDKIIKYFAEFIDQDQFTEFRFLGPFAVADRAAIGEFFTNINACTNYPGSGHHQHLLDVIKGKHLEIYEDCNGSTVIHKVTESEAEENV